MTTPISRLAAGRDIGPSILAERLTAYQVFLLLKLLESAVTELTTGSHYQRIALADKIANDVAALKAIHQGDANPPAEPVSASYLAELERSLAECEAEYAAMEGHARAKGERGVRLSGEIADLRAGIAAAKASQA